MSGPGPARPRPKSGPGPTSESGPGPVVPGPRPAVWAPRARTVELVLAAGAPDDPWRAARRVATAPGDRDGWWLAPHDLPDGTDYGFSLDGGPPRPDPRSPRQPYGVHGPSRTFDPAFTWTDAGPARDVRGHVLYELHVGTYTPQGTLDAAAAHLDELADLGVGAVELLPLAAFPGRRGWGYDGVDLYAVHEPYGGPAALQRYVDAAHRAGIAVVLDVVHNHLGPSGNYLAEFGPYFTRAHHTPWGAAVNLDQDGSGEVRRWIVDGALRWLRDFHLDGLRLDAVHALVDDSPRHLLAELSDAVAALAARLGRPLTLIAESDENDPATVRPTSAGGRGMSAQWADDVHHAIHALLTGERHGYYVDFGSVATLRKALTGVFVHDGTRSTFRGRTWGAPLPPGQDGHAFVVCASDHDQVGNRALGDRPAARLDGAALATAATLVLCSPFTPMVFMGEEWGASTPWQYFTDHDDPALARAVAEGRVHEFEGHDWADLYGAAPDVPDPQDPATRDASVLDRAERTEPGHARLLTWYRTLVALRAHPAVASGDLSAVRVDATDDELVVTVVRPGVLVVVSLDDAPRAVPLPAPTPPPAAAAPGRAPGPAPGPPRAWRVAAAWDEDTALADDGRVLALPRRGVAVLLAG